MHSFRSAGMLTGLILDVMILLIHRERMLSIEFRDRGDHDHDHEIRCVHIMMVHRSHRGKQIIFISPCRTAWTTRHLIANHRRRQIKILLYPTRDVFIRSFSALRSRSVLSCRPGLTRERLEVSSRQERPPCPRWPGRCPRRWDCPAPEPRLRYGPSLYRS